MISLEVKPQPALSWKQFLKEAGPYSIALDGYVYGGPRFDSTGGPKANFNHHEEVDRLATRATCAQVLMALRQGLYKVFRTPDGPTATVYVNDCDEDVCTSWFLLKNPHLAEHTMNPLLNRLVALEDALDATAGAYPYPADLPALRELAWVFEPYRRFRLNGGLPKRDAGDFTSVIEDVGSRIQRHITGTGKEIALDTRYEVVGGGSGWTMVREVGAQARTGMFSDGIQAFVSVTELPNNRWGYVVGRLSSFIPADLPGLCKELNTLEGSPEDPWGGSDIIMGSPRQGASTLSPQQLTEVMNRYVIG